MAVAVADVVLSAYAGTFLATAVLEFLLLLLLFLLVVLMILVKLL